MLFVLISFANIYGYGLDALLVFDDTHLTKEQIIKINKDLEKFINSACQLNKKNTMG